MLSPRFTPIGVRAAASLICFGLSSLSATHAYAADPSPSKAPTAPASKEAKSTAKAQPPANAKPAPVPKKSVQTKPAGKTMAVAPMRRQDFPKACGCGYYAPTAARQDGPLLLWLDQQGRATVTVDGVRENLQLSSERMVKRRKDSDKLSAGDRMLLTLRSTQGSNPLQASISSAVERNCTISASQCSSPTFKSLITLSRGDSRKSLSTWSVCSCPGSSKPYTPPPPAPKPTVEPGQPLPAK